MQLDDVRTSFRGIDDGGKEVPELLSEVLIPAFDVSEERSRGVLFVEYLGDVVAT